MEISQSMNFDLHLLLPEFGILFLATLLLLISSIANKSENKWQYPVTLISMLLISVYAYFIMVELAHTPFKVIGFSGHYVSDYLSSSLKLAMGLCYVIVILYSKQYIKEKALEEVDYLVLSLCSLLGMFVLVSAYSLLTIFLGIELLSLPLYALVALHRDNHLSNEAALKYFIMGSVASGIFLYGVSILYGLTGTVFIPEVSQALSGSLIEHKYMLILAMVCMIVALGFKVALVPFHAWLPDVYVGSAISVTLFIATVPKLAAFGLVYRILVDALGPMQVDWQQILLFMSLASFAVGNVFALAQTDIRRLLGYSAIAHMGYMLLGFASGTVFGYGSSLFYMMVYVLTSMAVFGYLVVLNQKGLVISKIEDLKGLNKRQPKLALMLLLCIFSLAGIPPLVGFFAKLMVLKAIVDIGLVWMAAIALGFAIIGAYYYIRLIKFMYFDAPVQSGPMQSMGKVGVVLDLNALALLLFGIFPQLFMLFQVI